MGMLKAAYPHGDDVEGRREDPEGLPHPVLGGQAEVVAQAPQHDAGELYRDPLENEDPPRAQTTPSKPSTRPTVARKSTKLLFTVLSFRCFSQDSKNNPGKSKEGIATETAHSTTTTTPRACPARSLALAANP